MNVANERAALRAKSFQPRGEIAEQALGFRGVGDAVGADVNDGGAGAGWMKPML